MLVFKTSALNHSAILPLFFYYISIELFVQHFFN
ncbi:hypothetical protein ACQ27_gp272 [Klebsiella phage K64-1]|nr:hypothetical protein ACQ27_gp272 [Klebsiella phage K64-1]